VVRGRHRLERRLALRADGLRLEAARVEAAAGRRRHRAWQLSPHRQPPAVALFLGIRDRNGGQQCLRVRVLRSFEELVPVRSLTTLPRYMTATRSAMCLTSERSWAMNRYERPSSACKSSRRLRICPRIEMSSVEAGSSEQLERCLARMRKAEVDAVLVTLNTMLDRIE
jgi:hypothetical protein